MIRISLLLGLLSSMPAYAADIVSHTNDRESPLIEAGQINWSGLRLGIFGGISSSSGEALRGAFSGALIPLDVSNGLFPDAISEEKSTLNGGVSLGYDFQNGNFIAGVEADITFQELGLNHDFSRVDPNPSLPFTGIDTNTTYQTQFGNMATIRARAGLTYGDFLFYATAGIAAGRVRNRFTLELPALAYSSPGWSKSGTRYGYAAGAGVEYNIKSNMSVKLEGMYVDLADTTVNAQDPVAFPGEAIAYRFKNDLLIGKIGLNFRF